MGEDVTDSGSELLPRIFAQAKSNPQLYQLCHERVILPRWQRVQEALRLGIERGELAADLDVEITASMLVSPVLMYNIINSGGRRSGRKDFVARLVKQALKGWRRRRKVLTGKQSGRRRRRVELLVDFAGL